MPSTQTASPAFQTVPNDLLNVLQYTLPNGLRLFLSVNKDEPRIFTNIAVRAGSKQDPAETTGLAHYMEHMLFKGTSRIGALDWEKEKVYLEQISDLYEQHRATTDEEARRSIYAEIDRLSFEAAQLVAPNEYDKLSSIIGAKATNAYTWLEQTVYVNDIPSNELERWMQLESERFRMMALRLFHTELETVYEEFNINQDRDFRKVNYALREELFPTHPYGTQTTLGSAEHLRNPSHVNIQRYFQTYYVPNNMAIMMAGDFEPETVVALAEKYFGDYVTKPIPPFVFQEQAPVKGPIRRDVFGKESEYVTIGWRLPGSTGQDFLVLTLIQHLLYNQQAGLLDLNLNQLQQVLESEAWTWFYEDYSAFGLYGKPREGQTLEEVENLLLRELAKLRNGEFEDWLLEAVVNDFKLGEIRASESNEARVNALTTSFILGIDWTRFSQRIDWMAGVSRQQIIDYAREHLRDDNFVVINKRQGEDPNVIKVEKPPITPVELNRDALSEYAHNFLSRSAPALSPVFADFESYIQNVALGNSIQLDYVQNPNNQLFRLDFIFEMGKLSDLNLALALVYLPYLGAGQYSAADLQKQFFRLGLTFDVQCDDDRSYISLAGLEDSLEEGLKLVEYIMANAQPDEEALQNVVSDILLKRQNAKSDRNFILRNALGSYGRYGVESPFRHRLSAAELMATRPDALVRQIRELFAYEHRIHYYGQLPASAVAGLLEQYHQPGTLRPVSEARRFNQLDTPENQVFFLDFPIVQTDVLLLSKGTPVFNLDEHLMRELYNDYFGYGLSSIVFQEIRESKALAYSTYAFYSSPRRQDQAHYLQAYVGTQPDKLPDAIPAMLHILNDMPAIDNQIEQARQSILKRIESERILPGNIYWTARNNLDLGYYRDLREDLYRAMERANARELVRFQEQFVRNRRYTYLVLGSRERIDLGYLGSFGPVRELGMEEVFGY